MTTKSPLPDYDAALAAALEAVATIDTNESVELAIAAGRILAEPVCADRDLPPFERAQMDGYAVRSVDIKTNCALPVMTMVAAGASPDVKVPAGSCIAIATGAAVPNGLDAVIPHEQSDRGNPVRFTIDSIDKGNAIHRCGADAKAGDVLIQNGTRLGAQHIGIAAAVGSAQLQCTKRPRAIVLSSGDEVRQLGESILPHQIRNSNGPMIARLLGDVGAEFVGADLLPDDLEVTIKAVAKHLDAADIVITIGGISAGDRDHFPAAFDAAGVKYQLRGAAIQPGKPIIVARAPNGTIIVGLPGNPVSSLVCACLFIWPIVTKMLGCGDLLPWREVTLAEPVKSNPKRRAFRPVILQGDNNSVIVPAWAGSGDLAHTATTHGVVRLPMQDTPVAAGQRLRFLPWPWRI